MLLLSKKKIVLVNVYYRIPDYHSLINQFSWQTIDIEPEFPRVKRFLNYWQRKLTDAPISKVEYAIGDGRMRAATFWEEL